MRLNEVADGFISVASYNGYTTVLKEWRDQLDKAIKNNEYSLCCPLGICSNGDTTQAYIFGQLQVLWMFLVTLFGDYGTSPRYGWIEKMAECKSFLDDIIKELEEEEVEE